MQHLCSRLSNMRHGLPQSRDQSTGSSTVVLTFLFNVVLTKVIFKVFLHFLGCAHSIQVSFLSLGAKISSCVSMTVSHGIA